MQPAMVLGDLRRDIFEIVMDLMGSKDGRGCAGEDRPAGCIIYIEHYPLALLYSLRKAILKLLVEKIELIGIQKS